MSTLVFNIHLRYAAQFANNSEDSKIAEFKSAISLMLTPLPKFYFINQELLALNKKQTTYIFIEKLDFERCAYLLLLYREKNTTIYHVSYLNTKEKHLK